MAEAELALRRLFGLAHENGDATASLETFSVWSQPTPGVDPLVASLAACYEGIAVLMAFGDVERARETWKPLGFLENWYVIGSFDNVFLPALGGNLALVLNIDNAGGTATLNVASSVVPEPSSFALLGIGVLAMAGYGWRQKRCSVA